MLRRYPHRRLWAEGVVDPDLDKVFGRMQLEAWALFDRLRRAIDIPGHSSLYFDNVRLRKGRGYGRGHV